MDHPKYKKETQYTEAKGNQESTPKVQENKNVNLEKNTEKKVVEKVAEKVVEKAPEKTV